VHLVGLAVGTGAGHGELLTDRPEAEQTNAELALDALGAVCLETSFDRIADVRAYIAKIRDAIVISGYTLPVIAHHQVMLTPFPTPGDVDLPGTGVNAVFHELSHRFERIALRQRDDGDGVPIVTDTKPSGVPWLAGSFPGFGHVSLRFRRSSSGPLRPAYKFGLGMDSRPNRLIKTSVDRKNSIPKWSIRSTNAVLILSAAQSLPKNAPTRPAVRLKI